VQTLGVFLAKEKANVGRVDRAEKSEPKTLNLYRLLCKEAPKNAQACLDAAARSCNGTENALLQQVFCKKHPIMPNYFQHVALLLANKSSH
jgi:hypothetical protein